jgi:hypothetical protein
MLRQTFIDAMMGRTAAGTVLGLALAVGVPAMAQAQFAYPAPPPPPPVYAQPVVPEPPPGAVWVGAPGECLYGNGQVYWCAPGVVFAGFPPEWDFGRYPVFALAPEIVVDPVWFGGWRRGHPGFAFRGRIASAGESRAFFAHRDEIVRNGVGREREAGRGPRYEPRRPEDDRR